MTKNRPFSRLLAALLSVVLLLGTVPATVMAAGASDPGSNTFNVSGGPIPIGAGTAPGTLKVSYGNHEEEDGIAPADPITPTGAWSDIIGEGESMITVDGITVDITLEDVEIDLSGTSEACAFEIKNGADVSFTLSGTNALTSGSSRGA